MSLVEDLDLPSETGGSTADEFVDLTTAAEVLGVHYQTAYKWVRSGRIAATVVGGKYRLRREDVEQIARDRSRPASPRVRKPRLGYGRLAERAMKHLLMGDETALRKLVGDLLSNGIPLSTVITEVLVPPLVEVGEQWHLGRLDVATEHRCSEIVDRVIGENMPSPRGRRRGTAVVTAVSGDRHTLPTLMAAVALREDNWKVEHLGADMPTTEVEAFCQREQPDLLVLTVTFDGARNAAAGLAEAMDASGVPTIMGGPGQPLEELVDAAREAKR